jgi:hypothetical protein
MAFVGQALGGITNAISGAAGIQQANIQDPVTAAQIAQANQSVQSQQNQQQALIQALQAQQGIQNQGNVYNQLAQVAAGQGPNPAQAMLNQATGQNVANQAALMAGQRGAATNVGLMARQAGQQGANLEQQAVGQGANMQAQQSLQALGGMGNLSTQQVGQQMNAQQAASQLAAQSQGAMLGAQGQFNQGQIQSQQGYNQSQAGIMGGLLGGLGAAGSAFASKKAHGGMIDGYANGGEVNHHEFFQKFFDGGVTGASLESGGSVVPGHAAMPNDSLKNDTVPAMLSPGEIVIPRHIATHPHAPELASKFVAAVLAKKGHRL